MARIVIKDFNGPGEHLYETGLGWQQREKNEARSLVSKKIFKKEIVDIGYNMTFYYIDNGKYYGIHSECTPVEVKELPMQTEKKYIGWQCKASTHDSGKVIGSFADPEQIWENLKIDGKSLEEVLERSVIMDLC